MKYSIVALWVGLKKPKWKRGRDGNGSDRFGYLWYPNPNPKILTKPEPDPNPFGFEKQKPEPDPTDLDRFRVLSKPELLQTPQSHDADGASIRLTPASSNTYVIQLPTDTYVIQPSPNPQLCIHSLFFADYITNTMASGLGDGTAGADSEDAAATWTERCSRGDENGLGILILCETVRDWEARRLANSLRVLAQWPCEYLNVHVMNYWDLSQYIATW